MANCNNVLQFPKDLAKDVRCNRCRKNVSLKEQVAKMIKIEELYREAAQSMQSQKVEEAIDMFKEGIDMFFQIAVLPHKDTLIAQNSLTKCLATLSKWNNDWTDNVLCKFFTTLIKRNFLQTI